jgi:ketosteroid isomerase-like protein
MVHLTEAQKEVWQMEQAYWDYLKNKDLAGYMALWHPDFTGWPKGVEKPANKQLVREFVKPVLEDLMPDSASVNLTPYSIEFYEKGKIAIVYYLCDVSWKSKSSREDIHNIDRYIHVWLKQEKTWKIIGGMNS